MRTLPTRALPSSPVSVAVAALAAAAVVAVLPATAATAAAADAPEPVRHAAPADHASYIVTVRRDLDPAAVARMVGAAPQYVYRTALHGFSARLSPGQVAALRAMPGVEAVRADGQVSGFGT
ncbi:protease inhibitor I9 family protein [Streptomyces sp. NPDC090112]|uniref:protease inhibitor I9 family protein n=1 Tax=Streptomyces sp. NPDC090112 TaxID=3365949 RepID=UPI0037FA8C04